jgi:DNA repair exonuclease SbcCD ATPase subunit
MFNLKSLQVGGFRGFLDPQSFSFDSLVTILFGQNRCGKSSTLNAIEWSLFGDGCGGEKTKIRERIGWKIANQGAERGEVLVELAISDSDGVHFIRRSSRPRAGRTTLEAKLEIELPDGECLDGANAEQFLDRILRATFRDFATTVYQHQEAIRAIVTQEPRERNDAIDRLLGLSDYRNLLTALQKVNAKGRQKDFVAKWNAFQNEVGTALKTRDSVLDEQRNEAAGAGVSRSKLNSKAALDLAQEVRQALDQFAIEIGLEPATIQVPHEWTSLRTFCEDVRSTIDGLRGEIPAGKEQAELFERRKKVIGLQTELNSARTKQGEIAEKTRVFDKEFGGQMAVDKRLVELNQAIEKAEAHLCDTKARAALIRGAINVLKAEAEKNPSFNLCRLCSKEAMGLLEKLQREWDENLQAGAEEITNKIKELETEKKKLGDAAERYRGLNDNLEKVVQNLERCRQQTGELLGRVIAMEDDPLALLNLDTETIEDRLQRLSRAVQEKQARLSDIEGELKKIQIIYDILHLEQKKKIVEQIQQSPEYKELEEVRDRAAELVADLESIREAISSVTNEEARNMVAAARTTIDRYFRRLTDHPAVRINLDVQTNARTQCNNYEITDQDGQDLTPILSQGDLNALALAIFLGLAASAKDSGAFGFVLMDDPSQSLDSEHKKALVQVLNEVARQKQLVVATMDREFRGYLAEGLTKAKTEYVFEAWTPEKGPTIIPK